MGCKELIESLRASGDEKIAALRAGAGQEAEKVRADAGRAIEALRANHERRKAGLAAEIAAERVSKAQESARQVMLAAEMKLCDRLFALARSSLRTLRNEGYRDVFRSFAAELPRFAWKTARVNPDDADLARTFFPEAAIIPDETITGGLIVETEGGSVRVDNTFEKRLERAWEEMLPEIMKEVYATII